MIDFQQKRKVKSVMYHKATLVVLFIIVLVFARSTWVVFRKKMESEEMKKVSMQNVDALKARDVDLKAKISRLDTESGVEEEIRSKYSVVKEGESMVVIVPSEAASTTVETRKVSLWEGVKNFFLGK